MNDCPGEWIVSVALTFAMFGAITVSRAAIQIQQNADITRAQMINADRDIAVALKLAQRGENPAKIVAKSIDSLSELTT